MFKEILEQCMDISAIDQPGMVYEVWSDGEITLTKSGDLYGARNLHMISPPSVPEFFGKSVANDFPGKILANGFSSIPVKDFENAQIVRDLIKKEYDTYLAR